MSEKKEKDGELKTADLSLLDFLQQVSIVPGKLGVFESLEGLDLSGYFCLQGVFLLLVEKGYCKLEMNMNTYELYTGGIFVAFPGQVLHLLEVSDDIKPLCIACATDMVNDLMTQVKDGMQLVLLVKRSPCQQRDKEDFAKIVESFRHLQKKIQTASSNQFYYQILKHQLVSLAFECVGSLMEETSLHQVSNRKEALFNAFLRSVEENHRREHGVRYYADELFVTPKYLSAVADEMSGKGAKQWIDEYIVLDAKVLLQSTRKDIQEISGELSFPDVSFFGKFFKRMTGMSPKAFRQKKD